MKYSFLLYSLFIKQVFGQGPIDEIELKFGGQAFAIYKEKIEDESSEDESSRTVIATGNMHMYQQFGNQQQTGTVKVFLEQDEKLVMKLINDSMDFQCPSGEGGRNGPCTNNPDPVPTECGFGNDSNCFNWDGGRIFLHDFKLNGETMIIGSEDSIRESGWTIPTSGVEAQSDMGGNYYRVDGGGSNNVWIWGETNRPDNTDALPTAPLTAPTMGTPGGGTFGDPHFKTWNGKQFDFHGVCDLVLVSNLEFGNGIGLDVHIRTRKTRQWSYVDSAAARIGDDILEVRGGKNSTFWINGVQGNVNTDEMVIANYKIKHQNISEKSKKFVVDLGDGEGIIFKTWNSFVSVQIENPKHENFVGSVGLMGSFPEGLKIDRTNSIVDQFNVFGQEWQVLSTEQKLFHNIEDPQHPQKCEIPSSVEMRRRLAASLVTFGEAEKACVGADSDNKELCIFDIMATNDLSSAGVY